MRLLAAAQLAALLFQWVVLPLGSGADLESGVRFQARPTAVHAVGLPLGLADDGPDTDDVLDIDLSLPINLLNLAPGVPQPTLPFAPRRPASRLEPPPDPPPTSTV